MFNRWRFFMRTVAIALLAVALILVATGTSSAQPKMGISGAVDILIPVGNWGNAYGVGFGGDAQFQYNFTPNVSAGLTLGYFTWGGKSQNGVDLPGYKGLPLRLLFKYYFMPPKKQGIRPYAGAEAGLFFGSTGDVTVSTGIPGVGDYTIPGASSTDFNYVIAVGADYPVSADGKTMITGNVRWDAIATSGTSANNIAFRVGVLYGFGN
jgi:outer membrane protein W